MKENRILIDWLSFTTRIHTPEQVIGLLGLESATWQVLPGHRGYMDRLYFGSISIHYNGRPEMGVWLEMSGQGCRNFEQYGNGNFEALFRLILENPGDIHVTRIDVAYDDFSGILDMGRIFDDSRSLNFVSKFHRYEVIDGTSGTSAIHGSKKSDVLIRIYDKAAEQNQDGHWVRVELQLRDTRALDFLNALELHRISLGKLFLSVVANYLRFVVPSNTDSNKRRWQTADYWADFLQDVERIRIWSKPGVDYDIIDLEHYVLDMAGQAVNTYISIVGPEQFFDRITHRCWRHNPKYEALKAYHQVVFSDPDDTLPSVVEE